MLFQSMVPLSDFFSLWSICQAFSVSGAFFRLFPLHSYITELFGGRGKTEVSHNAFKRVIYM